mgnify:CR=1 FL=1
MYNSLIKIFQNFTLQEVSYVLIFPFSLSFFSSDKIDGAFSIDDKESLPIIFDLIQNEGLSLGTSCGVNIAGAIRLGKELGPGHTIVTILCDKSDRYNSLSLIRISEPTRLGMI